MAIVRHAYIRLKPEHQSESAVQAVVEASRPLADLPDVRAFAIVLPADDHARAAWDLALVVTFDDLTAFERYRVDPVHRHYVDEFLSPRLAVIKAWNFAVDAEVAS